MRPVVRGFTMLVRVALGGLLAFSGWMKLGLHTELGLQSIVPLKALTPMDFYFAINGFKMGLPEPLMVAMSFVIPWAEFLIGLALVFGVWARSAALLAAFMMVGFTAGIASVITRGLDVNCPCFGAIKLFCPSQIGPCHIVRNSGFFLAALWVLALGGGWLSVDAWRKARSVGPAGC